MSNTIIEVVKPGLATSVQDLGRTGFQAFGVVVSGAMDSFALQVGNILVGNPREAAGIEIVIMGPELRILEDTVLAICGADLSPKLDGELLPVWKSFSVRKGQVITFGQPKDGAYAYIAVAGGIDTPVVMGSKSTYTKAAIGGFKGRYLQKGDHLASSPFSFSLKSVSGRGLSPTYVPNYKNVEKVRVILGPDQAAIAESSIEQFLSSSYKVSTQSDRMGYRLEGAELTHKHGADILSDAVLSGTIQVPASGQPIVLLADRQTTGGYTRIGTVISVDLPFVAQKYTGSELRFETVQVEEAQLLYVKRERLLKCLSLGAGVIG
ncbi:biotin-dependent carboxyltransferase family protein [Oceanobacillus profundus]|uniref:5-oxoprolinase subunit C family protein n=1 Tax=Oceanobacillus profundus TaxID=372463 RepID=UPI00203B16CA|nr:biotin-dependent carboxyltransferase family protein [Oceanobacillus profundus]MCM3397476.1 biotin-dependent carboxyltransferase family protein [Oceanobacillus profundus]